MIGEATLVPPTSIHPVLGATLSYEYTGVAVPATAETSASARLAHRDVMLVFAVCQLGRASTPEHPLPAPFQAVSVHPRAFVEGVRSVPPTAVT
jgi:hypothetical protein